MSALDEHILTNDVPGAGEARRRITRAVRRNRRYMQIAAPTNLQVRDQTAELTKQMTVLLLALGGDAATLDPDPDQPGD